jgi:hypothetical protein
MESKALALGKWYQASKAKALDSKIWILKLWIPKSRRKSANNPMQSYSYQKATLPDFWVFGLTT